MQIKAETDLMDIEETCRFFGGNKPLNPATLYRGVKTGRYPRPIKVGPNTNRWVRPECQSSLEQWIAERDNVSVAK